VSALTLAAVLSLAGNPQCVAPGTHPYLAAGIVQQESGGDQFALHDDDTNEAAHPETAVDAERIVRQKWSIGRSVGVGLTQLTARSEAQFVAKFGLTVTQALSDACANLRAGTRHMLRASASIYNSGSATGAPKYAASLESIIARIAGNSPAPAEARPIAAQEPPECGEWHSSPRCRGGPEEDRWADEGQPTDNQHDEKE
jgi:Transglycosylase SLT domain